MKVPEHIGIIPDGNRRFAKRLLESPWKGHEWGIEKIKTVFDWCKELGIKNITAYSLSIENLNKRPKEELDFLLQLAKKEINDTINNKNNFIFNNRVKVTFFGRKDMLPKDLVERMEVLEDQTREHSDYTLNFAVAYGGREEILNACKKIAVNVQSGLVKPNEITEEMIRRSLYTNGLKDPDLIIRTSENRMSGFLLWQSAYSEMAFIDALWPELNKEQFMNAVNGYMEKERRFGK